MSDNKIIARTALTLFILAVALLTAAVILPAAGREFVSPEAALWAVGGLALLAAATGFLARRTPLGRVTATGGLLLLLVVLFVAPVPPRISL